MFKMTYAQAKKFLKKHKIWNRVLLSRAIGDEFAIILYAETVNLLKAPPKRKKS